MNKKYLKYLKSNEWAQLKIDLYSLRGRKCEKCTSTSSLHVHHLTYRNIFNENPEDLIILCKDCHDKTHSVISKNKYRKKKKFTILSLAEKLELKKKNKKQFKNYRKKLLNL